MAASQEKIAELLARIEKLSHQQALFAAEINELRQEVNRLAPNGTAPKTAAEKQTAISKKETEAEESLIAENASLSENITLSEKIEQKPSPSGKQPLENEKPHKKSNVEKFIGENLISKIGIAILVIGVAIGAKYAIDNELISPLTRIIIGYLAGLGLLGVSLKLRKKYGNFSAVLLSGAMAVLYFITYFGYALYGLMPIAAAFILMLVLTAFTVTASIFYKQQVIAIFGLVGAYAVPFLLSTGSGNVQILFGYMAIINIGILIVSFKRYWKPLFYVAFGLTWLIFSSWYLFDFSKVHLWTALIFLSVFFATFYSTFLAYKLFRKQKFNVGDVILLCLNSFIFYGFGYALINNFKIGNELLGAFTLANAVIHFLVGLVIYRQKLADKNIFYFVSGLVLVFITIAIPVQLNGSWVTLIWAALSVALFTIGSRQQVSFYQKLAYPLIGLTFISLVMDWSADYGINFDHHTPFFNVYLLSSLLVVLAFGTILYFHRKALKEGKTNENRWLSVVGILFLVSLYFAFYLEIYTYFQQLYEASTIRITHGTTPYPQTKKDYDLITYQSIWLINYTLAFFALFSILNIKKIKNKLFGIFNLMFAVLALLFFLIKGLYDLSDLRDSYLSQRMAEYYHRGIFSIGIRYVSMGLAVVLLFTIYRSLQQKFIKTKLNTAFDLFVQISSLWILSSELLNWLDIFGVPATHKLGLSIFWGIFSLWLIVFGLWKNKKHLRILAIVLFGVTLLKLFFYDIAFLDTISKTIVFVALGVLLLLISFLYNKYKHLVTDEN